MLDLSYIVSIFKDMKYEVWWNISLACLVSKGMPSSRKILKICSPEIESIEVVLTENNKNAVVVLATCSE